MPDLQKLLDRIQRIDAELKQPVAHDQISFSERFEREDELAYLGMTKLPQLAKALRAVMELHKTRVHDEDPTSPFCNFCGPGTPCETTQAITDVLEADSVV